MDQRGRTRGRPGGTAHTGGRPARCASSGPLSSSEVPEADRIEQAVPVDLAGRARDYRGERPEADEADWIDQGIVEERDDERPDR